MSRRSFIRAAVAVAAALAWAGVTSGDAPVTVTYFPAVSVETLAAWGWARWDEFTWG